MNQKMKALIREYAESLIIALILALIIRTFFVQAYKIPTGSMNPTLVEGDRILVNKLIYRFRKPERGEVIVFKFPENPRLAYIKRLIGLEFENLQIHNGKIYLDTEPIKSEQLMMPFYYNRGDFGKTGEKISVPAKSFYVLGDNSANSRDSRYWGFVPEENLIGKAILIYWPPHRIRLIE